MKKILYIILGISIGISTLVFADHPVNEPWMGTEGFEPGGSIEADEIQGNFRHLIQAFQQDTTPSTGCASDSWSQWNGSRFVCKDVTPPRLYRTPSAAIGTTNDTTPRYYFLTYEAGIISYEGACRSSTNSASANVYTYIDFNYLSPGTYSNCKIYVTDAAGNKSSALSVPTFTIDTTRPTLRNHTAVSTPTNDTTPNYKFYSSEAGTISYSGGCISSSTTARAGNNNPITFNYLRAETYRSCKIYVTDAAGNKSSALSVPTFVIDTTAPRLSQTTAVPSRTTDTTPSYRFYSSEAGSISYSGGCTSSTTSTTGGYKTITFRSLSLSTYAFCKIYVTDAAGNRSSALSVPIFTVYSPSLYSSSKTYADCTNRGGSVYAGHCKFTRSTCPSGWTPTGHSQRNWRTVNIASDRTICSYDSTHHGIFASPYLYYPGGSFIIEGKGYGVHSTRPYPETGQWFLTSRSVTHGRTWFTRAHTHLEYSHYRCDYNKNPITAVGCK